MKNLFYLTFFLFIHFFQSNAQILLNPRVDSIEMRDGKMLAADIYLPDTSQKYPVILIQTPYNRLLYRSGLPLGIGKNLKNSPYAFVIVDWRCFYGSAKACKAVTERGKDGYDVIDWIVKQSWSNGKVGTWGPSALGKIQYQTAKEQHPNHLCAVPIVAGSQFEYQEYYPNGVLRTEYVEQLDALGYNLKNTVLQHPYYDIWWQVVETANMYPDKIKIPMLLIGGWFDHNIDQMFRMFDTLIKASDSSVRDFHKFLIGPWSHNSVGKKTVGELEIPEAEGLSDSFAILFFDYWLRGAKNGWSLNKKYIIQGIQGNLTSSGFEQYDNFDNYFQSNFKIQNFYIYPNEFGGFLTEPGLKNDSFLIEYDPNNPSPTVGGPTLRTDLKQGPAELNDNVLLRNDKLFVFEKLPLHTGLLMTVKPKLDLFVSSNRFDTDFSVRLCQVKENSEPDRDTSCIILSDAIFRMRFRNGYSIVDTQTIIPGKIYKITLEFPYIYKIFNTMSMPGIIITSSNYPRFDLNLNNGKELYKAGDTLVAKNYIYFGPDYPSKLYFTGGFVGGSIAENFYDDIEVYPNPVNSILNINTQNLTAPFSYTIFNLQGMAIMKGKINENGVFSIDILALPPQLYFLKLENKLGVSVKKFIKTE